MKKLTKNINIENMTSREIAELTGKRHDHITRDVRAMLAELGIQSPQIWGDYKDSGGRVYQEAKLDKSLTLTLVSGYSAVMRKVIIDRWLELEQQAGNWLTSRNESAKNYNPMNIALDKERARQGKETEARHYICEANLLNIIILGTTASKYRELQGMPKSTPVRDTLTPEQNNAYASLEKANETYISMGLAYEDRKQQLMHLHTRLYGAPVKLLKSA